MRTDARMNKSNKFKNKEIEQIKVKKTIKR